MPAVSDLTGRSGSWCHTFSTCARAPAAFSSRPDWTDVSPSWASLTISSTTTAGVRFPRRIMAAAQVLYTVGLGFAYWLFHQAMFDIGALCPWYLLVTLATTLVWFELTHINIRDDNLGLPQRLQTALAAGLRLRLDLIAGVVWILVLVLAVVLRYGDRLFA